MPAVSTPRTECISRLASELCFASKPTLLRHLSRIDELAPNVDPDGVYPEDWIIFRVTGYRPEINSPTLIPGRALLGDLSALAERLSEAATLRQQDISKDAFTITTLMDRWSVSRKTIDRYRRLGLIARRIDGGKGVRTLSFQPEAVEWFEHNNADRLGYAAGFSRTDQRETDRIERWATMYRQRLGWSRSRTAHRIAQRTGRCHEGVRQILLRLDRNRKKPIFAEPGPPGTREQRVALRAFRRGIPVRVIADRFNRKPNAIRRAINAARYRLLIRTVISQLDERRQSLDAEHALATEPARNGLDVPRIMDLNTLINAMRIKAPTVIYEEKSRALGYQSLLMDAHRHIGELVATRLSPIVLDEIETSLRWATKLKAALLSTQLHLVLSTIENQIGGPIDTLQPQRAGEILLEGISVACSAFDRYNPEHGGRVAAPISLALSRFASRQRDVAVPVAEGKAARRISPGFDIADWTRSVSPWQPWLDPDPRLVGVLDQLEETDRLILRMRHGFGGTMPRTIAAVAEELGLTRVQAVRQIRRAHRAGIDAGRGG